VLLAAVAGLETRASLQTRVGIATALVVVSDLIRSGEARERRMVAPTARVAPGEAEYIARDHDFRRR
jgi:hypothetical protein